MVSENGTQKNTDEAAGAPVTQEDVREVLTNVYDPELQLSIIELGLVYDVEVKAGGAVRVKMTLTSMACPYGAALVAQVKDVLLTVRGIKSVDVEVVWSPPWTVDKMSEEARLDLGL